MEGGVAPVTIWNLTFLVVVFLFGFFFYTIRLTFVVVHHSPPRLLPQEFPLSARSWLYQERCLPGKEQGVGHRDQAGVGYSLIVQGDLLG